MSEKSIEELYLEDLRSYLDTIIPDADIPLIRGVDELLRINYIDKHLRIGELPFALTAKEQFDEIHKRAIASLGDTSRMAASEPIYFVPKLDDRGANFSNRIGKSREGIVRNSSNFADHVCSAIQLGRKGFDEEILRINRVLIGQSLGQGKITRLDAMDLGDGDQALQVHIMRNFQNGYNPDRTARMINNNIVLNYFMDKAGRPLGLSIYNNRLRVNGYGPYEVMVGFAYGIEYTYWLNVARKSFLSPRSLSDHDEQSDVIYEAIRTANEMTSEIERLTNRRGRSKNFVI